MSIRAMIKEDLDRIINLENQLFLSPWTKEDFIYELDHNPFAYYLVYENNKKIIGYIGTWMLGDQCQITTIGVDENEQNAGYASLLMNFIIKKSLELNYKNINLEVRVSNDKAIALYQKYKFQKVAIRKDYYEDHEDAYLMIKELEG
ncbi:MAG: ribosomal protein S18-alanine N-acetyltransferase [Faecalibacillus sp.]